VLVVFAHGASLLTGLRPRQCRRNRLRSACPAQAASIWWRRTGKAVARFVGTRTLSRPS